MAKIVVGRRAGLDDEVVTCETTKTQLMMGVDLPRDWHWILYGMAIERCWTTEG